MAVADWLRQQRRVYFGNASSVRDYRAQLRGSKPALLWSIYLGLLVLFVTLAYANIVAQGEQSITLVQTQLKSFYQSVLGMLELMVALVAPVIVGMSIQAEVQRKSLDLVTTAPVSPKYFLVGKVISGYRYIIMLLFLSLPISAAAVMLGGATWGEVVVSYLLVAMHGLLYIGVSLPIAVLSGKVVPAVIYSYLACWTWAFTSGTALGASLFLSGSMSGGGSAQQELPYFLLLFPFGFAFGVDSFTVIWGYHVPNWILALATALLIVKFLIVGAGSAMTRIGSKETVSLRVHGLVLAVVLAGSVAVSFFGSSGGPASLAMFSSHGLGAMVAVLTIPIVFVLPNISTWSYDSERRHVPRRPFDLRHTFSGAPDGGLPYLLLLVVTIGAVVLGTFKACGGAAPPETYVYLVWLAGGWAFFWAMGWVVSSFTKTGVGTARKSHVAFTVIAALLPWPVLAMFSAAGRTEPEDVFQIYPIAGLIYGPNQIGVVAFHALEFWLAAALLVYWGENRRKSIVSSIEKATNERKPA